MVKPRAKAKSKAKAGTKAKAKAGTSRKRAHASQTGAKAKTVKKRPPREDRETRRGGKPATKPKSGAAHVHSPEFGGRVKREQARKGIRHTAPPPPRGASKGRKLSHHPEALRSRRRRAEARGIAEALAIEAEAKRERRRERDRERRERKRGGAGGGVSEYDLAQGWLEDVRDHFAAVTPTTLEAVSAAGHGPTPWLIVGRYDMLDGVDYMTLGGIFESLSQDLILEAKIHPQRLSQIRIIYSDPNAPRGEADSIVSTIAGWQFALGDIIGEILGSGAHDETALAVRYDETTISTVYIYFSTEITSYTTVWPNARPAGGAGAGMGGGAGGAGGAGGRGPKTQTVKLR